MAAVVETEGRKTYWSENERLGGFRKAGYKKERTTARSIILVSIGVIEIGRKSAGCCGAGTFGIGLMQASFH